MSTDLDLSVREFAELMARGLDVKYGRVTLHIEGGKLKLVTSEGRHQPMEIAGLLHRTIRLKREGTV